MFMFIPITRTTYFVAICNFCLIFLFIRTSYVCLSCFPNHVCHYIRQIKFLSQFTFVSSPSFYLLMCYQNISQSCLYVFIVVVGLCPQLSTKCHLMCRVLLLVTIVPSFVTIYQLNEVFFRFMFITFILYI